MSTPRVALHHRERGVPEQALDIDLAGMSPDRLGRERMPEAVGMDLGQPEWSGDPLEDDVEGMGMGERVTFAGQEERAQRTAANPSDVVPERVHRPVADPDPSLL